MSIGGSAIALLGSATRIDGSPPSPAWLTIAWGVVAASLVIEALGFARDHHVRILPRQ